jgi:putative DNA primase/helicase
VITEFEAKHPNATATLTDQVEREFDTVTREEDDTLFVYHGDKGIYKDDAERRIKERMRAKLGTDHYTKSRAETVINKMKPANYRSADAFGNEKRLVCVTNGILDITDPATPTLKEHSPDYLFLSRLPVTYDPDANAVEFEKFLEDVVREEDIPKLQEYIGYCLHHWGMPYQRALMLVGPTNTGKSTFLNVVHELLGKENIANKSLQSLANDKFAPASLDGKLANIRSDLDDSIVKNTGVFKELAAGDRIEVEQKYQPSFSMAVTQKQLYSANTVPEVPDASEAFYERWLHARFPDEVPKDERDPRLEATLTTDDELSGILNWALEGYARLTSQETFTNELSRQKKQALWQSHGDSISQFIEEEIVLDPAAKKTPKDDVYDAYRAFCSEAGTPAETKQKFSKRLLNESAVDTCRRTINGKQTRCYRGVRLVEQNKEASKTPWSE